MKNEKIIFVLPAFKRNISGGYKMVYEYSNRLAKRGYYVEILYDCNCVKNLPFIQKYKNILSILIMYIKGEPKWFEFDNNIALKICFRLRRKHFKHYTNIVVTAVETAMDFHELRIEKEKNVLYFVQDYENWEFSDSTVDKTYKYDMKIISVSNWLKKLIYEKSGVNCFCLSNCISEDDYYLSIPLESEERKCISMLYHFSERKGCKYGLEVLELIHKHYPKIDIILFGSPDRPKEWPKYIQYIQNADTKQVRDIYNKSLIFLCPSLIEGYGLTGAESMMCGAALVSTSTKGVYEYAQQGINAMISEPKDIQAMYNNCVDLINNPSKRIAIAREGVKIKEIMNWDKAIDYFEEILYI